MKKMLALTLAVLLTVSTAAFAEGEAPMPEETAANDAIAAATVETDEAGAGDETAPGDGVVTEDASANEGEPASEDDVTTEEGIVLDGEIVIGGEPTTADEPGSGDELAPANGGDAVETVANEGSASVVERAMGELPPELDESDFPQETDPVDGHAHEWVDLTAPQKEHYYLARDAYTHYREDIENVYRQCSVCGVVQNLTYYSEEVAAHVVEAGGDTCSKCNFHVTDAGLEGGEQPENCEDAGGKHDFEISDYTENEAHNTHTPDFQPANEGEHFVQITRHMEQKCKKCGYVLVTDYNTLNTAPHSFGAVDADGNHSCMACGYTEKADVVPEEPEKKPEPQPEEASGDEGEGFAPRPQATADPETEEAASAFAPGVAVAGDLRMGTALVELALEVRQRHGADASVRIRGAEEVLTPDERARFDALTDAERMLVILRMLGHEGEADAAMDAENLKLSAEAEALIAEILSRLAAMAPEKFAELEALFERYFPVTVEGGANVLTFTLEITVSGEAHVERFGFAQEGDIWKLVWIRTGTDA